MSVTVSASSTCTVSGGSASSTFPPLVCGTCRVHGLVRVDAQVPERSAGRVLSRLLQERERAAAAQSREDHAPGPVFIDHLPRVEGVRAPIVDAVREHQRGRREAVTSDVGAFPDRIRVPFGEQSGHRASPCRAALVVPTVRAHRDEDVARGRSRLLKGSGQVARRIARLTPFDAFAARRAVDTSPSPARPAGSVTEPRSAGAPDGGQPHPFRGGPALYQRAEVRGQDG